jgi:hypothetical protein
MKNRTNEVKRLRDELLVLRQEAIGSDLDASKLQAATGRESPQSSPEFSWQRSKERQQPSGVREGKAAEVPAPVLRETYWNLTEYIQESESGEENISQSLCLIPTFQTMPLSLHGPASSSGDLASIRSDSSAFGSGSDIDHACEQFQMDHQQLSQCFTGFENSSRIVTAHTSPGQSSSGAPEQSPPGTTTFVPDSGGSLPIPDASEPLVHLAVASGQLKMLKYLLHNGHVSVDVKDSTGYTPLQRAVMVGRTDMVGLLIEAGAAVISKDD